MRFVRDKGSGEIKSAILEGDEILSAAVLVALATPPINGIANELRRRALSLRESPTALRTHIVNRELYDRILTEADNARQQQIPGLMRHVEVVLGINDTQGAEVIDQSQ